MLVLTSPDNSIEGFFSLNKLENMKGDTEKFIRNRIAGKRKTNLSNGVVHYVLYTSKFTSTLVSSQYTRHVPHLTKNFIMICTHPIINNMDSVKSVLPRVGNQYIAQTNRTKNNRQSS